MADDEVTPLTTTTANYGWVKPDVGASDDAWGGMLNADLDGIDATIKTVSNTAIGDNRIINGNFAINQRVYVSGTVLATTIYGHDRWKAGPSGCTYTFTAALPDTTITITANTLTQIIEAGMIEGGVYTLSWTGTAQARVYQGSPTGSYAANPIVTASLTAGTNTIVEFNAGTLTKVKLEIGSVATPYNRQSLAKSMADCQRYYTNGVVGILGYAGVGAQATGSTTSLPVRMRAAPSIAFGSNTISINVTGNANADNATVDGFRYYFNSAATGAIQGSAPFTAAAEL